MTTATSDFRKGIRERSLRRQRSPDFVVEEYDKTSPLGYSVTARLEQMLVASSLAIVVMPAEDEQHNETLRARQNVIHEIGLFQGRLGFERVIVLRQGGRHSEKGGEGISFAQVPEGERPRRDRKSDAGFGEIGAPSCCYSALSTFFQLPPTRS